MKNYQLIVGSPVDYEFITVDIVMNGYYIARLQREEGMDNPIIEIYPNKDQINIKLSDFEKALSEAMALLAK